MANDKKLIPVVIVLAVAAYFLFSSHAFGLQIGGFGADFISCQSLTIEQGGSSQPMLKCVAAASGGAESVKVKITQGTALDNGQVVGKTVYLTANNPVSKQACNYPISDTGQIIYGIKTANSYPQGHVCDYATCSGDKVFYSESGICYSKVPKFRVASVSSSADSVTWQVDNIAYDESGTTIDSCSASSTSKECTMSQTGIFVKWIGDLGTSRYCPSTSGSAIASTSGGGWGLVSSSVPSQAIAYQSSFDALPATSCQGCFGCQGDIYAGSASMINNFVNGLGGGSYGGSVTMTPTSSVVSPVEAFYIPGDLLALRLTASQPKITSCTAGKIVANQPTKLSCDVQNVGTESTSFDFSVSCDESQVTWFAQRVGIEAGKSESVPIDVNGIAGSQTCVVEAHAVNDPSLKDSMQIALTIFKPACQFACCPTESAFEPKLCPNIIFTRTTSEGTDVNVTVSYKCSTPEFACKQVKECAGETCDGGDTDITLYGGRIVGGVSPTPPAGTVLPTVTPSSVAQVSPSVQPIVSGETDYMAILIGIGLVVVIYFFAGRKK